MAARAGVPEVTVFRCLSFLLSAIHDTEGFGDPKFGKRLGRSFGAVARMCRYGLDTPGNGCDGRICRGRRPPGLRPLHRAGQLLGDGEARSSARKAAHVPGSKRNTTSSAALLSRTPTRPPTRRAASRQCPLLMLYELFHQSPGLHSSPLSPAGALSPIDNPSVWLR